MADVQIADIVHFVAPGGKDQGKHLPGIVVEVLDDTPDPVLNLLVATKNGWVAKHAVTHDGGTQTRGTWHHAELGEP